MIFFFIFVFRSFCVTWKFVSKLLYETLTNRAIFLEATVVLKLNSYWLKGLLPTTPTIFLQRRQQPRSFFRAVVHSTPQRGKIISVVGNSAEKIHELKLERFLPRCHLKRRKMIDVVDNNVEHFSELWATTQNSIISFLWTSLFF